MAAMATSSTVAGLGGSPLCVAPKPSMRSSFLRSQVAARNPLHQKLASGGKFTCFARDWLRRDLNVIGFGLIGWIAPSSIPLIDGKSLTGLFFDSIGTELAHWPTGPALASPFWLWLITWHLGLFFASRLVRLDLREGPRSTSDDPFARLSYFIKTLYSVYR